MSLPGEPRLARSDLRLRSALSLDSNKPDSKDFHLQCSLLSPRRPCASSSSSSSGSTTGGIDGSRTYAGDHLVSPETTKIITGARITRPGHRRSGSEPPNYFSNAAVADARARRESSAVSSPATNTLPAGNIYPSGKVGRSGILNHSTAAGSDVLGNGARNYGHGSIVRRGIGGCGSGTWAAASAGDGLDPATRRAMVSTDPEEVRMAGNDLFRRGRFEDALRLYDRAVAICPHNASCRSNRAAALTRLGKLDEALKSYEEALKLEPSSARAHQGLGSLHIRFGQVERARRHLFWPGLLPDQIELKKLQEVELHIRKCTDARKIGDWKTVLSESHAAVQAGSDSSSLLITAKAEASLWLNRLEEADSIIQRALQLDISSPPSSQLNFFGLLYNSYTHMVNAQVEMALGRFENAVSSAEKACLIDPGNVETRTTLKKVRSVARARTQGNELFNAGKFEEACLAYGEGLKFAPSNPVLYCNRAACMSKLGLWEKTIEDCNEALRVHPNHTKALLRRAASNGKLGRWAESVRDYEVLRIKLQGDSEVAGALLNAQVALKASRGNDVSKATVGGQFEVITELEQFQTAISLHGVVVVHFMAASEQRGQIYPSMNMLSRRFPSLNFLEVDINKNPDISTGEKITVVPTFKIYKRGVRVKEIVCPSQQVLEHSVRLYSL
ncbi:TPR repeat-containing thioredoxin TTL1 [Platanthera zijinensis]|uniref:TPR repeat-containing thioredoxin TTL1 n=1 Tax=Platanthera zijinensis TaxID=2320716 RepID=A0AAP0FTI7_9ASPA